MADAVLNGLAPHADWLMPNAFELGLIAGRAIDSLEHGARCGAAVRQAGAGVFDPHGDRGWAIFMSRRGASGSAKRARLPRAPKGAGDLLSALFVARRVRGDAPAIALEGATGGCVRRDRALDRGGERRSAVAGSAGRAGRSGDVAARAAFGAGVMAEGYVAPGFERVREAFDAGLAEEIGAGFAAIRDGEVVVDIWGGWADRAQTRPWAKDTIVPVYSTTKGVSAIVMALLARSRFARLRGADGVAVAGVRRARQGSASPSRKRWRTGRRAGISRADRSGSVARSAGVRRSDRGACAALAAGQRERLSSDDMGLHRRRDRAARARSVRSARFCAKTSARRSASISRSARRRAITRARRR